MFLADYSSKVAGTLIPTFQIQLIILQLLRYGKFIAQVPKMQFALSFGRPSALPINITPTLLLLRTIHLFPPKNSMLKILHNSPTQLILQLRTNSPHPHPHIIVQRTLSDLIPRYSELRTPSNGDEIGTWHTWNMYDHAASISCSVSYIAFGGLRKG
jgi:hypothetical protein